MMRPNILIYRVVGALCFVVGASGAFAQSQETGGIGGTGIAQETGGIGGTGISPQETGGIGGTGLTNTGQRIIGYGTIQAFGSIIVNGRDYGLTAHTGLTIDGQAAPLADLQVGQRALVSARVRQPGQQVATEVSVTHAIIGPISAKTSGGFSVLGQRIVPAAGAVFPDAHLLIPGTQVAVSAIGLGNGTWVATRVDVLPVNNGNFQLQGQVDQLWPAQGGAVINGEFILINSANLSQLHQGEPLIVTGQINANSPVATGLVPAPQITGPSGTTVEIEDAFVPAGTTGRLVAPDGVAATAPPNMTRSELPQLSVITGKLNSDGGIVVSRITIPQVPRDDATRPMLLNHGEAPETTHEPAEKAPDLNGSEVEPPTGIKPEIEPPEINPPEISPPEISPPEISPPEISPPEITTPDTND
ncbi:MAG TPA: DUF5666 domain-containing protein [Acidocella sp.]|nr:DUF5666 domain-containing protein [Acidocella sp.]